MAGSRDRADTQVGIVVLIVGSILPGMYYGFYGQPILQALYMAGILAAGLTSGYVSPPVIPPYPPLLRFIPPSPHLC